MSAEDDRARGVALIDRLRAANPCARCGGLFGLLERTEPAFIDGRIVQVHVGECPPPAGDPVREAGRGPG